MTSARRPNVVVTGATRGIGRALVEAFIARGCNVTFCGRDPAGVDALARAAGEHGAGLVCDVGHYPDMQALWDPGVVPTELLRSVYAQGDPARWRRQRWLFKFIADPVEVVCPWLVERVLTNRRPGRRIAWMTVMKAALRFFLPRYHRRDLFASEP